MKKKFKWPWSKEKKVVKRQPADISDFKKDLEPFWRRARDLRAARDLLDSMYQVAKGTLWEKIEEIMGHELPGKWTFNAENYTVRCNNDDEPEVVETEVSPSDYEAFWKKMQETFYHLRGSGI